MHNDRKSNQSETQSNTDYDLIIIGGGIVGVAAAFQIQQQFPKLRTLLLEKENGPSKHQTGHNSGVIHSGVYYKPKSAKAELCISGYQYLIDFCNTHQIPYDLIGKYIVANNPSEVNSLHTIYQNGIQNGLTKIEIHNPEQVKKREQHVTCVEAIWVPYTGIVNYSQVVDVLIQQYKNFGGSIQFQTEVNAIKETDTLTRVSTTDQIYHCKHLICCAGLQSDRLAKKAGLNINFKIVPFKGNYYKLKEAKKNIVSALIYPVPNPNFPFLGVHYTRKINGDQELGPNAVLSLDREGYAAGSFNFKDTIDAVLYRGLWKLAFKYARTGILEMIKNSSPRFFAKKASEMTAGITEADIVKSGSGIRAQALDKTGNMIDDFLILKTTKQIHVCNAPSPAATASLAIGKRILEEYKTLLNS